MQCYLISHGNFVSFFPFLSIFSLNYSFICFFIFNPKSISEWGAAKEKIVITCNARSHREKRNDQRIQFLKRPLLLLFLRVFLAYNFGYLVVVVVMCDSSPEKEHCFVHISSIAGFL